MGFRGKGCILNALMGGKKVYAPSCTPSTPNKDITNATEPLIYPPFKILDPSPKSRAPPWSLNTIIYWFTSTLYNEGFNEPAGFSLTIWSWHGNSPGNYTCFTWFPELLNPNPLYCASIHIWTHDQGDVPVHSAHQEPTSFSKNHHSNHLPRQHLPKPKSASTHFPAPVSSACSSHTHTYISLWTL